MVALLILWDSDENQLASVWTFCNFGFIYKMDSLLTFLNFWNSLTNNYSHVLCALTIAYFICSKDNNSQLEMSFATQRTFLIIV